MDLSSQLLPTPGRSGPFPVGAVCVNDKWRGSELLRKLQAQRRVVIDDQLGVLDFRPSPEVGVVYVAEGDLASGNAYRRKLVKLRKAEGLRGVVVAEKTSMSGQYMAALQKFAVLELGLVLMPVCNQEEAAGLLAAMATGGGWAGELLRPNWPPNDLDASVVQTLQRIPKLGQQKARALLDQFHSIARVSQASEQELSVVIGPNLSRSVWTFLHETPE